MSAKIYIWTNPDPRSSQVAYAFDGKDGVRQIRTIRGCKGALGNLVARSLIESDLACYERNGWA